MKNNLIKLCSLVVFAVICFGFASNVKAEKIYSDGYAGKIYIKKEGQGKKMYLRVEWLKRTSDNQLVYCIEPWDIIDEDNEFTETNPSLYGSLSVDQLNRIKLLIYYGYGYSGHEDVKWYGITQLAIWRTVDPYGNFYFTDTANGSMITDYDNDLLELDNLVTAHSIIPSFTNQNYTSSIKRNLVLNDTNGVLEKYQIQDNNGIVKNNSGNSLTIASDKEGKYTINLVKKGTRFSSVPLIYVSSSQDCMSVGNFDDIATSLTVEFKSGKIDLLKKGHEKYYNEKITLENAEYEVFDEKGNSVGVLITNKEGMATLEHLPYGKYIIKERKASYGYAIDPKEYVVEINEEALVQSLEVYEDLDKKELEITKEYLDSLTNETFPEEDIYYDIYTEDGNYLIGSIKTNSEGKASLKLSYGSYIVRQRNGKSGYKIGDDFKIVIDENTEPKVSKNIINYPEKKIVRIPNTNKSRIPILPYLLLSLIVLGKKRYV